MALEQTMKRLTLRSGSNNICRHCCQTRNLSTTFPFQADNQGRRYENMSTAAFADSILKPQQPSTADPSTRVNTAHRSPASATSAAAPPSPGSPAAHQSKSPNNNRIFDFARSSIQQASTPAAQEAKLAELARATNRNDLETQLPRGARWQLGDVYAPHDLSGVEANKFRKSRRDGTRARGEWDVVDVLGLQPKNMYRNFSVMSEYVTEMGRLKRRNETGLRPVNQRRMAKAVRRAVGIGLMPSVHRHPEILLKGRARVMGMGGANNNR
ncbi:hypothetical protein MBLNU230_g8389t1 [Neophaeotheca triangularis]